MGLIRPPMGPYVPYNVLKGLIRPIRADEALKGLCLTGPDSKESQEIHQNSQNLPKIAFKIALK